MADRLMQPFVEALGEEFPLEGHPRDQLRAAVRYAILAPSTHNTQPWVFRLHDDHLDLYADRSRRLPVVDPDDRELVISCGAALFNLRLALRHFGIGERTATLPDARNPDLLARVRLAGSWEPSEEELMLFRAIPERHTDRSAFELRPVPGGLLEELARAAAAEAAWFATLDAADHSAAADLVGVADRAQMADPSFRRELAAWLRPNNTRRGDGIPGYAVGLGRISALAAPLLVRTFDLGDGRAAGDEALALGSPALAVLGTAGEHPTAWLAAGQALSRVLLRARAEGVAASFLNQPIEVARVRRTLERLVGHVGHAQLLLRLGYSTRSRVRTTPRRSVRAVTQP